MTDVERRILQNQTEILWALKYSLEKQCPNLKGKGGEFDRMCDDLRNAAKDTKALLSD